MRSGRFKEGREEDLTESNWLSIAFCFMADSDFEARCPSTGSIYSFSPGFRRFTAKWNSLLTTCRYPRVIRIVKNVWD